jgi:hypothetical protein
LTHRDALFDLTARWLNDDFHEGDWRIITEIFLYEGFISGSFVIHRMVQFLENVFGTNLEMDRLRQKHILRERLIQYMAHPTGRTEERVQAFRKNPEFFFPRLPINAVLVVAGGKRLVSIGRIKRLSRVAEKVSYGKDLSKRPVENDDRINARLHERDEIKRHGYWHDTCRDENDDGINPV